MKAVFTQKPHYARHDALRGVAALIVIVYHVFECFTWTPLPRGYLAVDFFFVLSGFVIGYAYDDRWGHGLSTWNFFRRRLVRLHPMVVMGTAIGAVCFVLQGSVRWDGSAVGWEVVLVAMLLGMLLLPLPVGAAPDVRGNGELFPLNGPHWSLFFEYLGNVCYALLLRRLPTRWLAAVCGLAGAALAWIAVGDGYLGVGWTMAEGGLWTGFVRMLFPYSVGMLMARLSPSIRAGHSSLVTRHLSFLAASLACVLVAVLPLFFGECPSWLNGLYDFLCVAIVFPAIVWFMTRQGASRGGRWQTLLGDLSYPLYAVHYPLMYLFYAYIGFSGNLVPIAELDRVWPVALALPFACILLGWLSLRFYDIPVRRWLRAHHGVSS